MAGFNRRRWTVKPPQGTPLTSGLYAPDVLAIPFNENSAGVVYNYALGSLAGRSATVGSLLSPGINGGKNGPRLNASAFSVPSSPGTPPVGGWINWADDTTGVYPTVGVTIMAGYRKTQPTTFNACSLCAVPGTADTLSVYVPFSDGGTYWDWNGSGGGSRISIGSLTFGDDVWAFTMGPERGQEIWQNGQIKATGSYGGARTAQGSGNPFVVAGGAHFANSNDKADFDFFYMWSRQIPQAQIQALSVRPFSVFDEYRTRIFPAIGIPGSVTAVTATAAAAAIAPSVSATVNLTAATGRATAAAIAPAVAGAAAVTAVTATAAAGALAPTVTGGASVAAVTAVAAAAASAPSITIQANLQPPTATAIAAFPVPTVTGQTILRPGVFRPESPTGAPGIFRGAVKTGAPSIYRAQSVPGAPSLFRMPGTPPANAQQPGPPSIAGIVSAFAASATAAAFAPVISVITPNVMVPTGSATSWFFAPSITVGSAANLTPSPGTALAAAPIPAIAGSSANVFAVTAGAIAAANPPAFSASSANIVAVTGTATAAGIPAVIAAVPITLALSSVAGVVGGTYTLTVTVAGAAIEGGSAVEWTFQHTSDVSLLSVALGASAIAASKSLGESGDTILIFGLNSTAIPDGILATAVFQVAALPGADPIPIGITAASASDGAGNSLAAVGTGGTITW